MMAIGERLHLQHGPIDLIVTAEGPDGARAMAFAAAKCRFATLLNELVDELTLLRKRAIDLKATGIVARRMVRAAAVYANAVFVTPMAAVAGAVADEILDCCMSAAPLTRVWVNNGGDIALHMAPGTSCRIGLFSLAGAPCGRIDLAAGDAVGGVATSGLGGRSHTCGIADAVTVLAATAAEADVAATLIANAVDIPGHPSIHRCPAATLDPDTDLGDRLVVVRRDTLDPESVATALQCGEIVAGRFRQHDRLIAAVLLLDDQVRIIGLSDATPPAISTDKATRIFCLRKEPFVADSFLS